MKNIHVLPTDKPSRLWVNFINGKFELDEKSNELNANHIYITSDEEINEGDWFLDDNNQMSHSYRLSHVKFANPKKIILTTDQDLIKDGVQAIDDEFLEWFVKNPSCEYVKIEDYGNLYNFRYLIIIPKEEPKQETLEEYIERETKGLIEPNLKAAAKAFLSYGAKWQQEQDKNKFSELELFINEVKDRIDSFEYSVNQQSYLSEYITKWFEQFKNK